MKNYWYLILVAFLIGSCNQKNKKPDYGNLSTTEKQMKELIEILIIDSEQHKDIGPKLNDSEIQEVEKELGISLPFSYKLFLKDFGNGADWVYHIDQSINGVNKKYGKIHWLGKYRNYLDDRIQSDEFGTFKTNTLLCLMTENSNGGAWVWLTSENSESGDWPLAYYSVNDQKLHFKVENFVEWIKLLTECKSEVIRKLDKDNILILG